MIEPMPLPSARPALPSNAAVTDVNISGVVVPRLTTVAPMMTLLMPRTVASLTDAETTRSAPKANSATAAAASSQRTHAWSASKPANHVSGIKLASTTRPIVREGYRTAAEKTRPHAEVAESAEGRRNSKNSFRWGLHRLRIARIRKERQSCYLCNPCLKVASFCFLFFFLCVLCALCVRPASFQSHSTSRSWSSTLVRPWKLLSVGRGGHVDRADAFEQVGEVAHAEADGPHLHPALARRACRSSRRRDPSAADWSPACIRGPPPPARGCPGRKARVGRGGWTALKLRSASVHSASMSRLTVVCSSETCRAA